MAERLDGAALMKDYHERVARERAEWTREAFFLVEATDFEHQAIWERWHERIAWEQLNPGYLATVGEIDKRPVCVCVRFARVGGRIVVFYEATSEAVDHKQVEAWLWKEFKPAKWDQGTRRAHCNATNFHLCAAAIKEANGEAGRG